LRYFSRGFFWRSKFGRRVWRVSLDAGLGCPNRDGTLDTRGCIFCDPASFSPSRHTGGRSITDQLAATVARRSFRAGDEGFVAYFQPGSNTYGPLGRLRAVYEEALAHPAVVGLAVGTRPDCVADAVLDLLAELSRRTWVGLELGLQTIHERSLAWLRRGHGYDAFVDAVQRSRSHGVAVAAHVILGLPGETREDMRATARELARGKIDAVKIHNLHAVRGTPLAELAAAGEIGFPELPEYAAWVVDFLERLPPDCVVDRLSGHALPQYLVAPSWCGDRPAIHAAVEAEFRRRDTWQGKKT
jgi:radical SAM protein (TIGR01212 family)